MSNLYVTFIAKHVQSGQMVNAWGILKNRGVPKTSNELLDLIAAVQGQYGVEEMTVSYMHEIDAEKHVGRIDRVSKADQFEASGDDVNSKPVYAKIDGKHIYITDSSGTETNPFKRITMSREQFRQISKYLMEPGT